ncbi:MAG: nucleotidyltransferase family protein [Sphingorhabdus sp.]|uniref:nucleotidyltransferase family protein n=1 Tax=Sphingorhabdus sp. TaxID=1902408 RepID=UPI00273E1038|nr:nucleotidyltransferase family protein [Sphingorhabdus sp.]MDP4871910.1 nucleotidyltransferase family protein [Sphingorhabdus sp.]
MQAQWTCIVLAGQRPGPDMLAQHFGLEHKALVPVCGEPMICHVVRTLHLSPHIGKIIILSQDIEHLRSAVDAAGGAILVESQNSISLSIKAQAETLGFSSPLLVTTADHPLLTVAMIDEFVRHADGDVAVAMVERQTMLKQFPDAQRTWLRFSDGAWSGANLFALMSQKSSFALELWAGAEQDRKKAWRLFLHFGLLLAIRALTRSIGLHQALEKAGKRLGLDARLVPMSDPVAAIDVDKLSDHLLAENILMERKVRSGDTEAV